MDILHTTYFGPIQWYQQLYRSECVYLDGNERWQKQTIRNRCYIATTSGVQALSVPIVHHTSPVSQTKNILISDHGKWRTEHWNALMSAYSESPFFEYYADDIRPFFEKRYDFLIDFNEAIRQTICQLIDIQPQVEYTTDYVRPCDNDYREVINAKHPQPDSDFEPRTYWQVFQQKHGFQANLSILDLLFCMGPESVFYL
jgi:hypothetical protein